MRIRKHTNGNGTTLITLSTLKDCNNKSINLVVSNDEKGVLDKLNLEKVDDNFIENINEKFGFSISLNDLDTELLNIIRL